MEVTFKSITRKESKLEVQHKTKIKKGDTFSEEQHFKFSSEREADNVKKESILDLGGGKIHVSVKIIYGRNSVFEIESPRDINNVKVIKHADEESAFELLITLLPDWIIGGNRLIFHNII